jgi:hypothetical protein
VSPERDLAEDAADGSGLVATAQVRERVDGVARRVEAAVARKSRHRMRRLPLGERILVLAAGGEGGAARLPHELVQDRTQAHARSRLRDHPSAPADDRLDRLANSPSDLHQRAPP